MTPAPARTAAGSTATHEATERRAAARALLMHPVLTAARHPEEMALVRRHAAALKSSFTTILGYPLVVEAGFARLIKPPLAAATPTRAARRGRAELSPRAYTYLALVCAGLLAPGTGEQLVISGLLEQLRADAASCGISVDDTLPERRHLVTAIEVLLDWGVLTETDGTVAAWGERREEALLTINRGLLPHLLARPLHGLTGPEQLCAPGPEALEQPRRDLRRLLVENPLVRREDLTDAERDVLSRERSELTRVLEESFGLHLEVRAEGALAYDTEDELTDTPFPGNGTVRQAALLLLDALVDTLRPHAGAEVALSGRMAPGVLASWAMVDDNLDDLAGRNAKVWSADYTADLPRLRREVVALLGAVSLAAATDEGLALHPACYRYRPEPVQAPANTTRARHRLSDVGQPEDTTPEASLFDQDPQEPA